MIQVIVVGMGPIGVACARSVESDRHMQLVGLVDIDPSKRGLTLDDLDDQPDRPDTPDPNDARVVSSIAEAVASSPTGKADVAIVTTTSKFDRIAPTLREALAQGLCAVTSCEEMSWPWYLHPELSAQIDREAKQAGKALLGTGINPGFVMDSLAVVLSTAVRRVTSVRCVRRVDAALRRLPLQAKVGATMTVEQFNQKKAAGKLGHVGLPESVAMLAHGLGHKVTAGSVQVNLDPVVATSPLKSGLGLIEPGFVAGIHNTAHWHNHELTIDLDLTMAVGTPEPKDIIELGGPVAVKCIIKGGFPGDSATVAVLVNYARMLPAAAPGLHSMLSLPSAGCQGADRV